MPKKYEITPKFPKLLHGSDYNPEQWLKMDGIFENDIELMKIAGFNCVTVGVFSWSMLEPEDGVYDFEWLDKVIFTLYENGIYTILSTPTGARPVWMTHNYPEVSRVESNRVRNLHGGRHNHCYSSPVYRRKTKQMNLNLANRYANHPAVILWHISNEIQGQCFCELCQEKFREWLRVKYNNDLEAINDAWYTIFWSQKYTEWSQIQAPAQHGMPVLHGLNLDWNRFCTDQTVDFYKEEAKAVKSVNSEIPVTINMMGYYSGLNYYKFKDFIDVTSWDAYPSWHEGEDDFWNGLSNACYHDVMRSMLQKPFMLMENTPSTANWCGVSRQKRPLLHRLASLQAVAHGSNTVQYFQWRQSRGSCEKWHSAVVSHNGSSETRIFKDVADIGECLKKIESVYSTDVDAKVGIIFDIENKWAVEDGKGPRNIGMDYNNAILNQYRAFWEQGINCDVIDSTYDFSKYDLLVAPMLYMLRDGVANRIKQFVENGGTLFTTYFTGLADETDLCFLGETPAQGLNDVLGIWSEDIDALYNHQSNSVVMKDNSLGLEGEYKCDKLCELSHVKTAKVLAEYGSDFYKGMPAFTVNEYGNGKAYYLATNVDFSFLKTFYISLCKELGIEKNLEIDLPYGTTVGKRSGDDGDIYFIQNFNNKDVNVILPFEMNDILEGEKLSGEITLRPYDIKVVTKV